jgi:hypothetical protein
VPCAAFAEAWADESLWGSEAIAAVEIAHESGDARSEAVSRVLALGAELCAVLTKLVH